jgi:hypothetical protein
LVCKQLPSHAWSVCILLASLTGDRANSFVASACTEARLARGQIIIEESI